MGRPWAFLEAAATDVRSYRRRSLVVRQGDELREVIIVRSGLLRLDSLMATGQRRLIRLAHPGDVVGLMSAFLRATMQVSIEAALDSELLVIPAVALQAFLAENPRYWEDLFRYSLSVGMLHSHRSRVTSDSHAAGRVRHTLAQLAYPGITRPGESADYQTLIPLTHQDLADYCGLNRVTVTLALQELARQGLVRLGRRSIAIRSVQELQRQQAARRA